MGIASLLYLPAFHFVLMLWPNYLMDLASSHVSAFCIATLDVTPSAQSVSLTPREQLLALLAKQLSPTKRYLLLVENLPQAVLAVIYLLVEGGSILVGVLNVGIPLAQVLTSVFLYPRVQKGLGRWYAKRFDAAVADGDEVVARRLWAEMSQEFMKHVLPHSRMLGPWYASRFDAAVSSGNGAEAKLLVKEIWRDVVRQIAPHSKHLLPIVKASLRSLPDFQIQVRDELDGDTLELCDWCMRAAFDGKLYLARKALGGKPELVKALLDFASAAPWVQIVSLRCCGLTSEDAIVVASWMTAAGHVRVLVLDRNRIDDRGAEALAAALPRCNLEGLEIYGNELTALGGRLLIRAAADASKLRSLQLFGLHEEILPAAFAGTFEGESLLLDKDAIDDFKTQMIAEAFAVHRYPQVKFLALRMDRIGDQAAQALAEMLTGSEALCEFRILGKTISEEARSALLQACQQRGIEANISAQEVSSSPEEEAPPARAKDTE